MLNFEKKNILTLVLFEKKFLNETKNHNSPLQVKWSVPKFGLNQGNNKWKLSELFSIYCLILYV